MTRVERTTSRASAGDSHNVDRMDQRREGSTTPVQPTPKDKNPGNRPSPSFLTGAAEPRASALSVTVSLPESAVLTGQGCALGKRAAVVDIVSSPQDASQSLEESVSRSRVGRKFLLRGYKTTLKLAKANGESVGEDEILTEELTETVDKFSLSLTNKDFQTTLVMSIETFHNTSVERLLKAIHIKTTSERLNKEDIDRMRGVGCRNASVTYPRMCFWNTSLGSRKRVRRRADGGVGTRNKSGNLTSDRPLVRGVSQVWDTRPVQTG